jgi:hypothetical protein
MDAALSACFSRPLAAGFVAARSVRARGGDLCRGLAVKARRPAEPGARSASLDGQNAVHTVDRTARLRVVTKAPLLTEDTVTVGLKNRVYKFAPNDLDWYMEAYARTAQRLEWELNKPTGLNVERLERKLQHLYDHIIEGLADDARRREKAEVAKLAIVHVFADRHLPEALAPPMTVPSEEDWPKKRPKLA